jgi:hypothetical protein
VQRKLPGIIKQTGLCAGGHHGEVYDCSEEGAGSWTCTCTWRYEGDEAKELEVVWVGELLSSMVQM